MKFSYAIPTTSNIYGELVVIDVETLDDLAKLCKRIRGKDGQFWPPIEEQLYKRSGYDEKQTFKYNDLCKKLKNRLGLNDEKLEDSTEEDT